MEPGLSDIEDLRAISGKPSCAVQLDAHEKLKLTQDFFALTRRDAISLRCPKIAAVAKFVLILNWMAGFIARADAHDFDGATLKTSADSPRPLECHLEVDTIDLLVSDVSYRQRKERILLVKAVKSQHGDFREPKMNENVMATYEISATVSFICTLKSVN